MTRERASRQISAHYAGLIAARIGAGETGGYPNLPLASLKIWQGWKESNLRMPESKSGALTNLATPLHGTIVVANNRPTNRLLQKINLFLPESHLTKLPQKPVPILPTGQWMRFQVAALANLPAPGGAGQIDIMRQLRKYSTSRAGHSAAKLLGSQPIKRLANLRTHHRGNRLQVVSAKFD
jgi:hypothetical protein